MTPSPPPAPHETRLRRTNLILGSLHGLSAAAMLTLSNDFSLPVTATFLDGPPGDGAGQLDTLFDVRLGPAIAAFMILSSVFHFLVASPWGYPRYLRELRAGRNRFRWVEYSLSASLMIVLIAMLTGVSDVVALVALFGVNASMILFGWLMETVNPPDREPDWTPFWFGCVAGVVPWFAIGIYLWGPGSVGEPPAFVYGIFVSLFVFFNSFAINQWLQYKKAGRWADYYLGERTYMGLSLVAKSLLAWQIYANTLVG